MSRRPSEWNLPVERKARGPPRPRGPRRGETRVWRRNVAFAESRPRGSQRPVACGVLTVGHCRRRVPAVCVALTRSLCLSAPSAPWPTSGSCHHTRPLQSPTRGHASGGPESPACRPGPACLLLPRPSEGDNSGGRQRQADEQPPVPGGIGHSGALSAVPWTVEV